MGTTIAEQNAPPRTRRPPSLQQPENQLHRQILHSHPECRGCESPRAITHCSSMRGEFLQKPRRGYGDFSMLDELHLQMPLFPRSGMEPMTVPAAFLIQTCGWKGCTDGRLGVYHGHAFSLVHHGGASGKDVLELAQKISDSVWRWFAIRLQPEVNIVH